MYYCRVGSIKPWSGMEHTVYPVSGSSIKNPCVHLSTLSYTSFSAIRMQERAEISAPPEVFLLLLLPVSCQRVTEVHDLSAS